MNYTPLLLTLLSHQSLLRIKFNIMSQKYNKTNYIIFTKLGYVTHLLFSSYESSFLFFSESTESNHFLLAHILHMNESHDLGRPFKVAITTSAFFTSSFTASSCSWFERLLWLHGFCILYLHILELVSQSNILIYILPFK